MIDVPCRLEGGSWDGLLGFVQDPVPELISVHACPDRAGCGCHTGAHWARGRRSDGDPYRLIGFDNSMALYQHGPMDLTAFERTEHGQVVPA